MIDIDICKNGQVYAHLTHADIPKALSYLQPWEDARKNGLDIDIQIRARFIKDAQVMSTEEFLEFCQKVMDKEYAYSSVLLRMRAFDHARDALVSMETQVISHPNGEVTVKGPEEEYAPEEIEEAPIQKSKISTPGAWDTQQALKDAMARITGGKGLVER